MLAPRKKLWSTPPTVLDTVSRWIELSHGDVVADIGCGDGRVIQHLASFWTRQQHPDRQDKEVYANSRLSSVSFIGIDINPDRIQEAKAAIDKAKASGQIHAELSISFYCENALEATHLFQYATIFFLYLIPRGLKIFKPFLYQVIQQRQKERTEDDKLRVITYMSPLPDEPYIKRQLCQVDHQPGASWPVYLYHLGAPSPSYSIEESQNDV